MSVIPPVIGTDHPDFTVLDIIRTEILLRAGGDASLTAAFPLLVRDAMEFVLDPVSTGRTKLELLDKVEKTFIGLKAEHFFRDLLDVPKGLRDLIVAGLDVDVKSTVRDNWMIPQETYSVAGPCVLIHCDEENQRCSLGLFLARDTYLNAPNRDKKRSISSHARPNILWLVKDAKFPDSHWSGFDMNRFRELRKVKGGTKRAAQFFRENLRKRVHRSVLESLLFDQGDYMKRVRENGGARDILCNEKIAVLSGNYDASILKQLGISGVMPDEMIAVSPFDLAEEQVLRDHRAIT